MLLITLLSFLSFHGQIMIRGWSFVTVYMSDYCHGSCILITEYLKLCGRHSQDVLYLIGCFGLVGGLRLQLTITQDLVSVLSLHLYCFYLYSAR